MANELLELKRSNYQKAIERKEGAYVPNVISATLAPIAWAGKRAVDVLDDPEAYAESMTRVFSEMWMDVNFYFGAQQTKRLDNAMKTLENFYGPDGTTLQHVQLSPMREDEYPLLLEDPDKYVSQVLLPRKYPQFYGDREAYKEALKVFAEDRMYSYFVLPEALNQVLTEKYGIFQPTNQMEYFETPLDIFFNYFRGFKGTLLDLRKHREEVKAAARKLYEVRCAPRLATPFDPAAGYAVQMANISPYLNPKQFDELEWPYEKQFLERAAAAGGKTYVNMEGHWERNWHHFLELPKDSCILHCDDDDIYKLHAELGDHQIICGGLDFARIRAGNTAQIKDDIKRLIDTCAPGGGFLLATNKAWIAPGDVNETLIEAFNFAHEYSSRR